MSDTVKVDLSTIQLGLWWVLRKRSIICLDRYTKNSHFLLFILNERFSDLPFYRTCFLVFTQRTINFLKFVGVPMKHPVLTHRVAAQLDV